MCSPVPSGDIFCERIGALRDLPVGTIPAGIREQRVQRVPWGRIPKHAEEGRNDEPRMHP